MANEIKNLRIHFYGVQGSGSVFPNKEERTEIRRLSELALLEKVFSLMQRQLSDGVDKGNVVEALLGAPMTQANLLELCTNLAVEEPPSYGGWTSCFRVETADGHDIVFDSGSGYRLCAQDLERKWQRLGLETRNLTLFGSHAHFDHTEGFDQADVCFNPNNNIHVYGNSSYLSALDRFSGVFSHEVDATRPGRQTPLTYKLMPAHFEATEIGDFSSKEKQNVASIAQHLHDVSGPVVIGNTSIQPFEVFHPDPCLAYRIEHKGKVFIYCTDHELRHGPNPEHPLQIASLSAEQRLKEHSNNADVLYRDGQFLRAEYDSDKGIGGSGGVRRRDWGHSCIEDIVEMAKQCKIKQTFIGHHDPSRTWLEKFEIDKMVQSQAEEGIQIQLAKAETVINL